MRIYLIGYMASGKSNLGRLLSEELRFRFIDLDSMFEERYKVTILDFFERYGEELFRKIEQKLLYETAGYDNTVIATGGGTPCFFDNMEFINTSGTSIYLRWEIPELTERLRHIRKKRPILKTIDPENLENTVSNHLKQRSVYYERAHVTVDGANLNTGKLADWIRHQPGSG
ncbi:MAG: shikimate kinase [Bacteroidales bacterium]|jgi:shikimate kinase|nr:shikimate kinase [Bacteroidales bacterium]